MEKNTKILQVCVPATLAEKLAATAKSEYRSVSSLVRIVLQREFASRAA